VSLIMPQLPHIGYGGTVYASAGAALQRRLEMAFRACLRYIHSHVFHLKTSVVGASLADYARIQLWSLL
jgi:hypothetical protein